MSWPTHQSPKTLLGLRTEAQNCIIKQTNLLMSFPWFSLVRPSGLQELLEILVHASSSQLLQAVVAMDDIVGGHHHHPEAVGVLAELAADGRAHDHVQAVVTTAGVSVIMAGEDCFYPCGDERCVRGQYRNSTNPSINRWNTKASACLFSGLISSLLTSLI